MWMRTMKKNKVDVITILLIIVLTASVIGAGYFAYRIFIAEKEYKQGTDIYDNIAGMANLRKEEKTAVPEVTFTSVPTATMAVTVDIAAADVENTEEDSSLLTNTPAAATVQPTATQVPFTPTPTPASAMDFTELLAVNPEVVGWITLPDSKVNYPVMHGKDNDFYLHHAITGEWNKVGAPYMDFRNRGDFTDRISVVYGHYMENGTMFTDFHKFKGQKYYDAHKTANLYTPNGDFVVEFVAGVIKDVNNWDFTLKFETNEQYVRYLTNNFKLQSTFKSDIDISAEDKYVIFSLCSYDVDNGRYLLLGRLKPVK